MWGFLTSLNIIVTKTRRRQELKCCVYECGVTFTPIHTFNQQLKLFAHIHTLTSGTVTSSGSRPRTCQHAGWRPHTPSISWAELYLEISVARWKGHNSLSVTFQATIHYACFIFLKKVKLNMYSWKSNWNSSSLLIHDPVKSNKNEEIWVKAYGSQYKNTMLLH